MVRRWERAVVANDIHVPFQDARAVGLFFQFCAWFKPDVVILAGDILDMWEVSHFDKDPRVGQSLSQEFIAGREFLRNLRAICPTARIVYIFGNHEYRFQRFLMGKTPELVGLEGMTVAEQLHTAEFGVEVVNSGLKESHWQYGGLFIGHYDKASKHSAYTAKALVDDKLVSIMQAHTHRGGSNFRTTLDRKVIGGWENFCLCQLNPTYATNPNWQHGFSIIYRKPRKERFQVYPILIVDYQFHWGNKEFKG